jgi:hypothetical protein
VARDEDAAMTTFSMLQILNAALAVQGYDEIVTDNDGSDEWRLLSRQWPLIVEAELEAGNYHFTRKQEFLNQRQDGLFGFDDAYLVPLEAMHIRRLWTEDDQGVRNTDVPWGQDGTRVHVTEPDGVFVEYLIAADPDLWGANFCMGVNMKLQAILLRNKEDYAAAQAMDGEAAQAFQLARTTSSKARSANEPYKQGRIALARFRRG